MGIVVTIIMLLGVGALLGRPQPLKAHLTLVAAALILGGLWNAAWYGMQHLSQFWGQAALGSGIAMLLAGGVLIQLQRGKLISPSVRWLISLALIGSFLLYAITLIQLNLGLPIIR